MESLKVVFKRKFSMLLLICVLSQISNHVFGQFNVRDSTRSFGALAFGYGAYLPGGDFQSKFGFTNTVNFGGIYKFKNNWLIFADYQFAFGNLVKDSLILNNVAASNGWLINEDGEYADILLYERGHTISVGMGKIIPIIGPNPNSGLELKTSVGLLQYKIKINSNGNKAPQLWGDYVKGYDRLSNGALFKQFVGYRHFSDNRLVNFSVGLELLYGLTQNRRSYDFYTMQKITGINNDILYGLRIDWTFPIYKRVPQEFYFQ